MADRDRLYTYLRGRESLLRVLTAFQPHQPDKLHEQLSDWLTKYCDDSETRSDAGPQLWWRQGYPRSRLGGLRIVLGPLVDLARWADTLLRAEDGASRYLDAAKAKADLLRTGRPDDPPIFAERLNSYLDMVFDVDKPSDLAAVVAAAAALPLTVAIEATHERAVRGKPAGLPERPALSSELVVKAQMFIDGQPWTGVQLIRANELHDIGALVAVPEWPSGSRALHLSYVTTYPANLLQVEELIIPRPSRATAGNLESRGTARFQVPHALTAGPHELRVRAAFELRSGEMVVVPVVGTYELPFRVSDPALTPVLKNYGVLDARVADALTRIDEEVAGVPSDHRADFAEAFQTILAFQLDAYLSATYKRTTQLSEAEFQRDIVKFLRAKLGEDVREGERRGGGPTDLHYRSMTIELKVERSEKSTTALFKRYTAQPTQYSSAVGRQLAIVLVLDLTEKEQPVGDLRNYVSIETPRIHGYSESQPAYPPGIIVVVVPGNLRNPSDYS